MRMASQTAQQQEEYAVQLAFDRGYVYGNQWIGADKGEFARKHRASSR